MPFVDYERLKFDYRNRVLWITIDAGKMNAVDFEMGFCIHLRVDMKRARS